MYANARRRHAILFRRDFSRKNYGESSQTIFNKLFSITILQIQKVEFVEVYQFLKNNSNGVAAQTEIAYWKNNNKKSFIFPKNTIDFGKDFSHWSSLMQSWNYLLLY